MMRCLNTDQKNLYQQYSKLSEKAASASTLCQEKTSLHEQIWEHISKEGVWSLPIAKEYGGNALSWQDFVVAIDGFFSKYSDIKFLTSLISQSRVLYLISKYGTQYVKKRYLPRLIKGEVANFIIAKSIQKSFHSRFLFNSIKNNYLQNHNKIHITVEKIKNDITFFIEEKQSVKIPINKSFVPILDEKNIFVSKETGLSVICDIINFEKLVYGILAVNFASRFFVKFKDEGFYARSSI